MAGGEEGVDGGCKSDFVCAVRVINLRGSAAEAALHCKEREYQRTICEEYWRDVRDGSRNPLLRRDPFDLEYTKDVLLCIPLSEVLQDREGSEGGGRTRFDTGNQNALIVFLARLG